LEKRGKNAGQKEKIQAKALSPPPPFYPAVHTVYSSLVPPEVIAPLSLTTALKRALGPVFPEVYLPDRVVPMLRAHVPLPVLVFLGVLDAEVAEYAPVVFIPSVGSTLGRLGTRFLRAQIGGGGKRFYKDVPVHVNIVAGERTTLKPAFVEHGG
jgi:hypothetical protein